MTPTTILAILLAVSVLANAALGRLYLGQRDATTAAQADSTQARAAAAECSAGVANLQKLAAQRKADNDRLRAALAKQTQPHEQLADEILATPASTPGDVCKSAQDRVDAWWARRGQP